MKSLHMYTCEPMYIWQCPHIFYYPRVHIYFIVHVYKVLQKLHVPGFAKNHISTSMFVHCSYDI